MAEAHKLIALLLAIILTQISRHQCRVAPPPAPADPASGRTGLDAALREGGTGDSSALGAEMRALLTELYLRGQGEGRGEGASIQGGPYSVAEPFQPG